MKRFCLFLVFVNIVYFFWGVATQQVKPLRHVSDVLAEQKGMESLSLLAIEPPLIADEAEKLNVKQLVEPKVTDVARQAGPLPMMSCYIVSDVGSEGDATQLLAVLKERELDASLIRELVTEEFWLVHSLASNWKQSLGDMKMLKAKGVSDLWLVPSGEDKGVISLGLFVTKARAEKRLKQLHGKQIKSLIRLRQKFHYSIKLKLLGDITQLRSLLNEVKSGMGNSLNKINC